MPRSHGFTSLEREPTDFLCQAMLRMGTLQQRMVQDRKGTDIKVILLPQLLKH